MILLQENSCWEYYKDFLLQNDSLFLQKALGTIPWRQVEYHKHKRGKVKTPRLTWVSGGFSFTKQKHPPWMLPLLLEISTIFKEQFNYVLYSKYNSPNHSISAHSDDEFFLGESPKIAILNIGDQINLNLINKKTRSKTTFDFKNNELILMKNTCQIEYMHSISKSKKFINKTRYSLSFRKVIHSYGDINYNRYN